MQTTKLQNAKADAMWLFFCKAFLIGLLYLPLALYSWILFLYAWGVFLAYVFRTEAMKHDN